MASITLHDNVENIVKEYAVAKEVSITEAANLLISSGHKRLVAIRKYAEAMKVAAKPARKAKATKQAAKGPLARKQRSTAKPRTRKPKPTVTVEESATVQ